MRFTKGMVPNIKGLTTVSDRLTDSGRRISSLLFRFRVALVVLCFGTTSVLISGLLSGAVVASMETKNKLTWENLAAGHIAMKEVVKNVPREHLFLSLCFVLAMFALTMIEKELSHALVNHHSYVSARDGEFIVIVTPDSTSFRTYVNSILGLDQMFICDAYRVTGQNEKEYEVRAVSHDSRLFFQKADLHAPGVQSTHQGFQLFFMDNEEALFELLPELKQTKGKEAA